MEHLATLKRIDLHRLVIFLAIYDAGSVSKGAQLLGLTQPAASNALSCLRRAYQDELFLRCGRGIFPTPKADQLAECLRPVSAALEKARSLADLNKDLV